MEVKKSQFSKDIIKRVWEKAELVLSMHTPDLRRDDFGNWIKKDEYGNITSDLGWVIDHIDENASGYKDKIENLRPLQWKKKIEKDCNGC